MLDFGFMQHDSILEAIVEGGYYHIYPGKGGAFVVGAYVVHENFNIGKFQTLYEALDAANDHYYGRLDDSQNH